MSNSIQEICFAYIFDIGQVARHAKRNNALIIVFGSISSGVLSLVYECRTAAGSQAFSILTGIFTGK